MIYGYLRVSSDEQDVNSQRQGVEQFAKDKGFKIEQYITDEGVSGGKDPDKRNLGPLLKKLTKGDTVIASEISRLGRDLYMVMDILHFCMKQEVIIYTVKDRFVLGDDIQSKVLAFAFGLAAEIERQMIRQRTKEGLMLRVKMGILLGRPPGAKSRKGKTMQKMEKNKQWILQSLDNGLSQRLIAKKLKTDRNTLGRYVHLWLYGEELNAYTSFYKARRENAKPTYKDTPYQIVELPREQVVQMIVRDMTIPQIATELPQFTYEEVYDTIYRDDDLNLLYRQHAQLKIKKRRY